VFRPLAAPSRCAVAPEDLAAYDAAFAYWGSMFAEAADPAEIGRANPWAAALLHSPPFALHRSELSTLLRTAPDRPGSFSHREREWVGMVIARHVGFYGVAAVHAAEAVRVGVRVQAIEALFAGDHAALDPVEALTAMYIRQVVDGTVDDVTFDALTEHLGVRGIVEYTYYVTMIWTVKRQFAAFGGPDSTPEGVIELARDAVRAMA
jgi:hypothetical protein